MGSVVGRLAPSPTGAQHLGNARTYFIAWLHARTRGGKVFLRIEDIDSPRTKPGAAQQALDDLRWLGLDWDGEVITQSERIAEYQSALDRLKQLELVYPCICTRSDIERAASAPHLEHEGPVYPGLCAHRNVADARQFDDEGRPYCWRFRVPEKIPAFEDGFRGYCELSREQLGGDFVVWKSGRSAAGANTPAYQLAVVVDDSAQGVTEVVRGDDLIPSTPRQILLYQALNLSSPEFFHIPLVIGEDGRRLAKRHGDTRLSLFRERGVAPGMIRGLLAWSYGRLEEICEISIAELLLQFSLHSIPKTPFVLKTELVDRLLVTT